MKLNKWTGEEVNIVKEVYEKNINLKDKEIAEKTYHKLRELGFFRTIPAITRIISINKKMWFNKQLTHTKNTDCEQTQKDVEYLEKYKFKYYMLLINKIFKKHKWEDIDWVKIENMLRKMHELSNKFKKE